MDANETTLRLRDELIAEWKLMPYICSACDAKYMLSIMPNFCPKCGVDHREPAEPGTEPAGESRRLCTFQIRNRTCNKPYGHVAAGDPVHVDEDVVIFNESRAEPAPQESAGPVTSDDEPFDRMADGSSEPVSGVASASGEPHHVPIMTMREIIEAESPTPASPEMEAREIANEIVSVVFPSMDRECAVRYIGQIEAILRRHRAAGPQCPKCHKNSLSLGFEKPVTPQDDREDVGVYVYCSDCSNRTYSEHWQLVDFAQFFGPSPLPGAEREEKQ